MGDSNFKFIDIGANLLDDMYSGRYHGGETPYHPPDLDAVLSRAWDAGIAKIVITAGSLEEAKAALALSRTDKRLFTTVGVHPTRCNEFENHPEGPEAYIAALQQVIIDGRSDGKVVAVGECGLDYDRLHFCEAETQKKWFEAQFEIAKTAKLPMFLHLRAATNDFLEIVSRHLDDFPAGVVHSFDGTAEELHKLLKLEQLHIGLNGCSLKTEENLAVAALVPVDRLHFETDAPWCEIRASHAGAKNIVTKLTAKDKKKHDPSCLVKGRNEPCNIRQVFEVIAAAKGMAEEPAASELAAHVFRNTENMYFSSS